MIRAQRANAIRLAGPLAADSTAASDATDSGQPTEKWLLRVEEVAELLDVGRTRVYELLRSGELRSVKIGGSRRVPSTVVRAYIDGLLSSGHGG